MPTQNTAYFRRVKNLLVRYSCSNTYSAERITGIKILHAVGCILSSNKLVYRVPQ